MCRTLLLAILLAGWGSRLAEAGERPPVRKPYGIEKRVPWTTSRIVGTPDPPPPYRTEPAFPALHFFQPLELCFEPSGGRWYLAERYGRIYTFPNDPALQQAELLLDVGKTVYGLAIHPRFAENGYIYLTYVLDPAATEPRGTRLSRFKVRPGNPPICDPASELIILEWPSGGHNGGCLQFGPDGCLYVVCGDGSGIADELVTGQDISDLLACILRIDVDHPSQGRNYSIPADNPFVDTPHARPEVYAYGLRQAWKINFDYRTGELWAGEVGQDLWEMIYRIERGGNYGWSVQEGSHPFRPERPRGPTPILPPVVEHPHSMFRSITGGHVYYGERLPELRGQYIYGDYDTGKVWAFRWDGSRALDNRELVDSTLRIIDFGEDAAGEIYLLDFMGGIHRLVPAPPSRQQHDFPRKLSETGLFASVPELVPAPGLIPYSVNAPLWSDGAEKERYLALPGDARIEYNTVLYPQPAPGAPPGWRFPDGTVVVKTFFLELEEGNPASRRRLETRILHHERLAGTEEVGDQVWRGYTYIWNDEQTEAYLLEQEGLDRTFTIRTADGGMRQQVWHFPSRTECNLCHTVPAKYILGLNTLQLNKDHDYGGVIANQLATFDHLGLFTEPLAERPEDLPRLVDYTDTSQPLDARARSYLHANCSHCHMKWGGGNAEFQLLATLPLEETGTLNTPVGHGTFGVSDGRVLVPGEPERSLVWLRMQRLGLGRMPHIASNVVDQRAVELIGEWIRSLPK